MLEKIESMLYPFKYPDSYRRVISLNLCNYDYWYLMDPERIMIRLDGLKKRFPHRKLIPFARRDDNDDIACFEVGYGERVFIVHDFCEEGYERREEYETFWAWFRHAIEEMINGESF